MSVKVYKWSKYAGSNCIKQVSKKLFSKRFGKCQIKGVCIMRKQNKMNSVLKASFLCIFLFTFLMLPIGCNHTSKTEGTSIDSQEITGTQETAQIKDTAISNDKEIVALTSNDDWNLVISFRNNSSANNPVNIKAYIDDKLFMDQGIGYTVHRPGAGFYFKLNEGEHLLKVETQNGETSLNQTFEITGRRYAHVDYFYRPDGNDDFSKKQFRFAIQNGPFMSM